MRSARSLALAAVLLAGCPTPTPPVDASLAPDAPTSDTPPVIDDVPASSDAGAGGDLEGDFCRPYAALRCSRLVDCGCEPFVDDALVNATGVLDVEACTERETAECVVVGLPEHGVVDREAAAAFLEAYARVTLPCDSRARIEDWLRVQSRPVIVEDVPVGGVCRTTLPCAGGLGSCGVGTCTTAPGDAEACVSPPPSCAVDLFCGAAGTCRPLATLGELCGPNVPCEGPLVCSDSVTCVERGAVGEPCDGPTCQAGLRCAGDVCTRPPTACGLPSADCGVDAVCDTGPTLCLPAVAEGGACAPGDCDASTYCDASVCRALPGDGEDCTSSYECAPGTGCDFGAAAPTGTCRPVPGDGETCLDGPQPCAAGLSCVGGTCGPPPSEGALCGRIPLQCATGLACFLEGGEYRCHAPGDAGETCGSDVQCEAGLHCNVVCVADLPTGAACTVGGNECAGRCARTSAGDGVCVAAPGPGGECVYNFECPSDTRCRYRVSACMPLVCDELR